MNAEKRKRARITPQNRKMIVDFALEEPYSPRQQVAIKLQNQFKAMRQPVPQLEVLERMISHFRNRLGRNPLDAPWGVQTLSEHPISAEGLPVVLEAWAYARGVLGHTFTIRDAMWVDRLHVLFQGNEVSGLTWKAIGYSKQEMREGLVPKTGLEAESRNLIETLDLYRDPSVLKAPISEEKIQAIMHLKRDLRAEARWPEDSKRNSAQPSNGITQRDE